MHDSHSVLSSQLSTLAAAITLAATVSDSAASPAEQIQQRCDQVAKEVDYAVTSSSQPSNFQVVNVSPDVVDLAISRAVLRSNPFIDVVIEVAASAQVACLYLSAASDQIDLGVGSSLTLRIGGGIGSRRLDFSSGTTLHGIAKAIRFFQEHTGVTAAVSGTGIRIESASFGSGAFVSVQALNSGSMEGLNVGFYGMHAQNTNAADPASYVPITFPSPVFDYGADVVALLNGSPVLADGATIPFRDHWLHADITLSDGPALNTANAQTIGSMTAFRIQKRNAP